MKTVYLLMALATFLVLSFQLKANQSPRVEICKFRDGKKAAAALTFDDGVKDHLTHAVPILEEYGFRGTFYVIINRVPATPNKKNLTWAEIKQIADRGHEIGNHSMTHYQLTKAKDRAAIEDEIIRPLAIFEAKIGVRPTTFCYPGNSRNKEIIAIAESCHIASTACRRFFYGSESFNLEQQAQWLDGVIKKGGVHHAMFHGIIPGGGGWKPFANEKVFRSVLDQFKAREKDLWVTTFADIATYEQLRDSATIDQRHVGEDIAFTIKATRHNRVPLTVKLSPCSDTLVATQGGKLLAMTIRNGAGYLNVIPDAGSVTLSRQ